MNGNRRSIGCRRGDAPLVVALILMGLLGVVCEAGSAPDRSEWEPGDNDRGGGFMDFRYSGRERELEPGDAAGHGDFSQTEGLGTELEPNDQGRVQSRGRQRGSAPRGLQNTIQEPYSRSAAP
ncbi:MAG: hypothetical protein HQL90_07215 [Magnetococcales bacterium]|nr:hypothetical protein [Magnetococcales bacterium]